MYKFKKELAISNSGSSHKGDDTEWSRHMYTLSLCIIVIVAFLLRTVFVYSIYAGNNFALSGGHSTQYHLHIVECILDGSYSVIDPTVNYPIGGLNIYPPMMDFIAAGIAFIISSTGFGNIEAASAAIGILNPIIGSLICIPTFLITKELFSKKTGIIAALIFAFLALPISTSVLSSGTEYATASFFVAFMSYFIIKVAKAVDMESKKVALINAVVAGLFLVVSALTWNGFRILLTFLIVLMIIQILIDRFRGRDFTISLESYSIIILMGAIIPAFYYIPAGLWDEVFSGQFLISVVAVVLGFAFKILESKSQILSTILLMFMFVIFMIILYLGNNDLFTAFVSGNPIHNNYTTKIFTSSHVSMSNVSAYYGWLTMWLPICLGIYELYIYIRHNRSSTQLLKTLWILSMFFAVWTSYANAAVIGIVFAVSSAAVITNVLKRADLKTWYESMRISGFPKAFRKLIKPLPFMSVSIIIALVIIPNSLFAIDAGMPDNLDSNHFFNGNTHFTLKTDDSYPTEDLWVEFKDSIKEGALVTWVDGTYDAVAQGGFRTITGTSDEGSSAVAQMYLSYGSAGGTAAMIMRLIISNGIDNFSSVLPVDIYVHIKEYMDNPSKAIEEVITNPSRYGAIRSNITAEDALYLVSINTIISRMDEITIIKLYDNVCDITNNKISYILLEPSMLPLQYGYRDSFSTISYIAGFSIDRYGAVPNFFSYNTYYGTTQYKDTIYNTFLWRAMIGPSQTELGYSNSYNYLIALSSSDGGKDSAMASPGYGLTGYEIAYWHVQYNPNPKATVIDDGWIYMDAYEAMTKQKIDGGLINYLSSIVLIKYVGIDNSNILSGNVRYTNDNVDGAHISVYTYNDFGRNILYSEASTNNGYYETSVPNGDYWVTISVQSVDIATYSNKNIPEIILIEKTSLSGTMKIGEYVYKNDDMKIILTNKSIGRTYESGFLDGQFSIHNMLPGVYEYKMIDRKSSSISSGEVTVCPGNNEGFIISPKTYNITVTVNDIFNNPLSDGTIILTDSDASTQYEYKISADGKTVIPVIPGKYAISLGVGLTSINTSLIDASYGNRSTIITAYSSKTISIVGAPIGSIFTVTSGSFSTTSYDNGTKVDIPYSMLTDNVLYTVYGINNGKVYVGTYTGGNSVLVSGSDAIIISGILKDGPRGIDGTIKFINKDMACISAIGGSDGKYSVVLPKGDYTIIANNGNDKSYICQKMLVSSGSIDDINLVDGRLINCVLKLDRYIYNNDKSLPFVLTMLSLSYENNDYIFYGMTDIYGSSVFCIPSSIECKLSINNPNGTLDNDGFQCNNLIEYIASGSSDYTKTMTIFGYKENTDNFIKSVSVNSDYDIVLIDNNKNKIEIKSNTNNEIIPGKYNATIDGSTGYYFNGDVVIYPGDHNIHGLDNVITVSTINISSGKSDIITIKCNGGKYFSESNGLYYFQTGYKYYITSYTNTNGDKKIAYGFIDLTSNNSNTYIDVTANREPVNISGYVGIVANGSLTAIYGNTHVVTDINDGIYNLELPKDIEPVKILADVTIKTGSKEYYYSADGILTGLTNDLVYNMSVISKIPVDTYEYDLSNVICRAQFDNGHVSTMLTIHNNSNSTMTYHIEPESTLVLDRTYSITIPAWSSKDVNIYGYYATHLASNHDEFNVKVSDINGNNYITYNLKAIDNVKSGDNGMDILTMADNKAFKDKISAYEYMYAITFDNKDTYSKYICMDITDISDDWTLTIMDESGKIIKSNGDIFTINSLQKTVLYVKIMHVKSYVNDKNDKNVDIPSIMVNLTGDVSKALIMNPQNVKISIDSMEASGDNIYEKNIPLGFWILMMFMVFIFIDILRLANKRGMFSCKK